MACCKPCRCPICGKRGHIPCLNRASAVSHPDAEHHARLLRCPLCYGSGRISTDLDAAFRLKYGVPADVDREQIPYQDLTALRLDVKRACSGGVSRG